MLIRKELHHNIIVTSQPDAFNIYLNNNGIKGLLKLIIITRSLNITYKAYIGSDRVLNIYSAEL